MALVALASPSGTHKGTTGFVSIRDAAILTGSYVGSDHVAVGALSKIALHIEFTKGSLTSVEIKMQYSDDGGTSWNDVLEPGSPSTGTYSPATKIYTFTADTTGSLEFDVTPYELVRFAADGTGTVTSSSLALSVSGGLFTRDTI